MLFVFTSSRYIVSCFSFAISFYFYGPNDNANSCIGLVAMAVEKIDGDNYGKSSTKRSHFTRIADEWK